MPSLFVISRKCQQINEIDLVSSLWIGPEEQKASLWRSLGAFQEMRIVVQGYKRIFVELGFMFRS